MEMFTNTTDFPDKDEVLEGFIDLPIYVYMLMGVGIYIACELVNKCWRQLKAGNTQMAGATDPRHQKLKNVPLIVAFFKIFMYYIISSYFCYEITSVMTDMPNELRDKLMVFLLIILIIDFLLCYIVLHWCQLWTGIPQTVSATDLRLQKLKLGLLSLVLIVILITFIVSFYFYSESITIMTVLPKEFSDQFIVFVMSKIILDILLCYIILYWSQLWTGKYKNVINVTVNANLKHNNLVKKMAGGENYKYHGHLHMIVNPREFGDKKLSSGGDKGKKVSPVGGPSTLAPTERVKPVHHICIDIEVQGSVIQQLSTTSKPKPESVNQFDLA